ncbi:MAG: G-protein coupled receptor, partial [Richelia sp. SM2_1_7]|nr:G-protein coupled receptor [Richelia sp. SM2_1_7]
MIWLVKIYSALGTIVLFTIVFYNINIPFLLSPSLEYIYERPFFFHFQGHAPPGILGDLYCKIWATKLFLWGFLVSSTYNLVALTVERYLAVVHPIWHKTSFSKNKAIVLIVLVWIFGPAWNASYMIV